MTKTRKFVEFKVALKFRYQLRKLIQKNKLFNEILIRI